MVMLMFGRNGARGRGRRGRGGRPGTLGVYSVHGAWYGDLRWQFCFRLNFLKEGRDPT